MTCQNPFTKLIVDDLSTLSTVIFKNKSRSLKNVFRLLKTVLTLILFLSTSLLSAQSPLADSLKNVLQTEQNDSLYNETVLKLINEGFGTNLDTAAWYLHILASRVDTSVNGKYTQLYFKQISIIERQKGNGTLALKHAQKAIDFNAENSYGIYKLKFAREKMGALNSLQDYETLISYGLNLIATNQDSISKNTADICRSVGTAYRRTKQYQLSAEYHEKAKDIYEQFGDLGNVGGQYLNLASINGSMDEFDKSIENLRKAIDIGEKTSHNYLLSLASQNLSSSFEKMDQLDSAYFYLDVAKEAAKNMNVTSLDIKLDHRKASILITQEKYREATTILRDLKARTENKDEGQYRASILKKLATSLEQTGLHQEANTHLRDALTLKDSIFQKDVAAGISDATEKYESDKKEAEIKRLALEDQLNETQISRQRMALGGSLAAFGLLSFFFYRLFHQKKTIDQQNREKEFLLKEIHHRVKNNLQVVSSLLGIQSRGIKDKAAKEAIREGRSRVHSMSLIHQDLYRKDNLSGINMVTYIPKLCNDLVNTYNINKDIQLDIKVDPMTIDVETVIPIGLIINELVTNSLKYAFTEKGNGLISIFLFEENQRLNLIVKDDGIGLSNNQLQQKEDSFGHTLIAAFRKKLDAEIVIDGSAGTTISLKIKKYKKLK